MAKRHNSFKDLEAKWEASLPPDLERRVSGQAANMAVFGRVVEVFVPNALEAVVHMISGTDPDGPGPDIVPGRRPEPDEWPDWRKPPKAVR
jgi:hypothetical protein